MSQLEAKVWQDLKSIFDPEIPVNIVDLGLIYKVAEHPGNTVHIEMTVTTPHCPAATFLPDQVKELVSQIEGVRCVHVEIAFQPAWSRHRISADGKKMLGYR
jgi:metal-sulfur cluster biosynthetic enzyme